MLGRLDAIDGLRTVGREDIEASLGADKQRAALGCDAVACMAEIGGALGVDLILHGQVGRVGSKYSVNVSVVRANDSRVIARMSVMTEQNEDAIVAQMDPMISELVDKLDARN
jgi:TolB-like protein